MAIYVRNGSRFNITNKKDLDLYEMLPVANYTVEINPMTGELFFEEVSNFETVPKVYGSIPKDVDRILNTYMDRPNSTGVMLSGEKGSGKSLMARLISLQAAKTDMPTLVVNKPLSGDLFNKFIQDIDQPCVVLFDEFEKVYDSEQQEALLTLLDGVFPSKKLFVFTCNGFNLIDDHMKNRPGRIFYHLQFEGLDDEFIREYCQENLTSQKFVEGVCRVAGLFHNFNFDMLKALVEDMNRYDESPLEAMKYLNAKPVSRNYTQHDIKLTRDGKEVASYHPTSWSGNPIQAACINMTEYLPGYEDLDDEDDDWEDNVEKFTRTTIFEAGDLRSMDAKKGEFIYEKDDLRLVFKEKKDAGFDTFKAYGEWFM